MNEHDDVASRIASAAIGHGDLDAAIADLRRLPTDLPGRGRLAAGLVEAVMRAGRVPEPHRLRELDYLLAVAATDPPRTPQWARSRTAARIASLMRGAMEREMSDPAAALAQLDVLKRESGDDPALEPMFAAARMGLGFAVTVQAGDAGALARLPQELETFLAGQPQTAAAEPLREMLTAAAGTLAAQQHGRDVAGGIRDLRRVAERLPAGDQLHGVLEETVAALDALTAKDGDGETRRITDAELAALIALAERPGLGDADRAICHAQAGMAALRAGLETDPGRVRTGVDQLRKAVELARPGDPQRVFHLTGLALALWRRSELTNATADRRAAKTLLEQARTLAGGPHHPQWQMINEMLAETGRMLGDEPDVHRTALEGMRGHVWKVLVQPDLAGATVAVRGAATDAVEIARRCLIANDPASAISALDAGRGLALFAATEMRTVGDRLVEAGQAELARRWRTAAATHDPDQLPPDLRRQVLTVLSAHDSAGSLLDPPTVREIQDALAAVDADALVYLVPGAGAIPGYAVIAPVAGPPGYMALPELKVDEVPDVERFLATLARRDLAAAGGTPRDLVGAGGCVDDDLGDSLDRLCAWAWGAAVGPLVGTYLPRLPRAASGRPYRVVLVPMGDLARIPWQAARRQDGRYAVELIAISQTASARLLCQGAALPPVPASPVGLVVGDPDTAGQATDLEAARLEAYAIRQSFYPGARYVGRRPDGTESPSGAGTVDQVHEWLATASPAAGAMLHLACHGFVEAGSEHPTAYLVLAGGKRLTAEELVALMARTPERAIGLVVLAACRTGLSITGYDEAYSLGTAFLAGGVRSVLSTQWSVPDSATSALMYMFHHFMHTTGRPAWAALREAQLWMLDPARAVPVEMPGPLRLQLGSPDLDSVVAWAAFVHWGQ